MSKSIEYTYIKNNSKYPNELTWVILFKKKRLITSHLNEDSTIVHVNRLNTQYINGKHVPIVYVWR